MSRKPLHFQSRNISLIAPAYMILRASQLLQLLQNHSQIKHFSLPVFKLRTLYKFNTLPRVLRVNILRLLRQKRCPCIHSVLNCQASM